MYSDTKSSTFNQNKNCNNYIDWDYPTFSQLDKGNDKNSEGDNILFHSWDKSYDIQKKNELNLLNSKDHEYDSYNYRMLLNSIEYKLNYLKNGKIKIMKTNSFKSN